MCDTRLTLINRRGHNLNDFLSFHLFGRRGSVINYPTAQRLLGHLPVGVSPENISGLEAIEERDTPIDQLIAPVVRSYDDFKKLGGGVVTRSIDTWEEYVHALVDEPTEEHPTGLVTVKINDIQQFSQDPRTPSLWPAEDYRLIANRPLSGRGHPNYLTRVATCAIALSLFSEHPEIPYQSITNTLRHFNLSFGFTLRSQK